jgi:hypothetical protein
MSKKTQQVAPKSELESRSDAELNRTSNETGEQSADAVVHEGDDKPAHSNLSKSEFKVKRVKSVAVPLFKLAANVKRFFLFDGAMFTGKKIDDKKEAAILLPVTDLETGEQGQIIVGKVLRELITETYPGGAYVGKKFETCLRKRADKAYNTYDLYEIETE